jgi:hypothetical protein
MGLETVGGFSGLTPVPVMGISCGAGFGIAANTVIVAGPECIPFASTAFTTLVPGGEDGETSRVNIIELFERVSNVLPFTSIPGPKSTFFNAPRFDPDKTTRYDLPCSKALGATV